MSISKGPGFSKSLFREQRGLSRSELAAKVSRRDPYDKREIAALIALVEGGLESPQHALRIWHSLEHAGFPDLKARQEEWYSSQKGAAR